MKKWLNRTGLISVPQESFYDWEKKFWVNSMENSETNVQSVSLIRIGMKKMPKII